MSRATASAAGVAGRVRPAVAALAALAGAAFVLGGPDLLAHLAPALLLLLPLLGGSYPGDAALARVARRTRPERQRLARGVPRRRRPQTRLLPRGGRLLAAGLAGRAPPARSS